MTVADLKRMANSNTKNAVLNYRYGEEIPKRLQGVRPIVRANSVAIFFLNADGRESELRIDSAKLVDYDGKHITIYEAGKRDLTEEEREIKRQEQAYLDAKYKENPYKSGYWAKEAFYNKNQQYKYLAGWDIIGGKKYDNNGKVVDNKVRGNKILEYTIVE